MAHIFRDFFCQLFTDLLDGTKQESEVLDLLIDDFLGLLNPPHFQLEVFDAAIKILKEKKASFLRIGNQS
jgi:hypothetical protein